MSDNISSNKRIAKNTIFLYIRMIVVMLVTLFTTRLVLQILGETDYGIYNVIGGVVVMFSFINGALTTATQRYLSFALGQKDSDKFKRIFNTSICCYIIIAVGIVILSETIGLWFVNNKLTIPENKMISANIVYQFTIATFIINILRIPFESTVIATEKMSFYAYLSVFEAILKLSVVGLLFLSGGNKLINYAALMMLIPLGCNIAFQIYCRRYIGCRVKFRYEKELFKELMGYTSWSMMGGIANVFARQGGNILMNIFYGVTVNAAFGIASQVNAAFNSLVSNFQTAFKPQIIKLYAAQKYDELYSLICKTAKFSFYLTFIILLPTALTINSILSLWLSEVPKYANVFAILLMTYCAIDAIQAPLIFLIYSNKNIKPYQIWLSSLLILNLPISFLFLKFGAPATAVLIVYVCLNFISAIIRTIYVKSFVGFPSMFYVRKVLVPAFWVICVSILIALAIKIYIYNFILVFILIILSEITIIYFIGLNKPEKIFITMNATRMLNKLRCISRRYIGGVNL